MRIMVEFNMPTEHGNEVVRSGKIKDIFEKLGAQFKPEAMYFRPVNGNRGGFMVINTDDPAIDVAVGEAFWFGLQAEVTITPCMNAEDLGQGLSKMPKILENFG